MSPRAAWRLESLGFTDVAPYLGGITDWAAPGLPVDGHMAHEPTIGPLSRGGWAGWNRAPLGKPGGRPAPAASAREGFPAENPILLALIWVGMLLALVASFAIRRYRSISATEARPGGDILDAVNGVTTWEVPTATT